MPGFFRDQLCGSGNLSPCIPQQDTAYALIAQIVNNALAERLLPVLDNIKTGIKFSHRFIAQIKQIGIEKRLMTIDSD